MTVAIKSSSDGEVIWFAAVLKYGRQFSANVSKHPLEDGSNISDHTTTENPIYTISGLISDVDFNQSPSYIADEKNERRFTSNIQTVVITEGASKFQKYLPESVGQFIKERPPTVQVAGNTPSPGGVYETGQVAAVSNAEVASKVRSSLERRWKMKEVFNILEYKTTSLKPEPIIGNCVITSLSCSEDADSGEGLYVDITLEQVAIANSLKIKIGKKTAPKLKNAAAAAVPKGVQPSTTTAGTTTADKLPKLDKSAIKSAGVAP